MRNPIKDAIAIAGVGTSAFSRDSGKTPGGLALEASVNAIRDAGVAKEEVDGIFGSDVPAARMQAALGLPATSWFGNHVRPFSFHLVAAMNAVFAGSCDVALVYHSVYRPPGRSRTAAGDLLRVRSAAGLAGNEGAGPKLESVAGAVGYAAWASRYLKEYGAAREHLGYVAINSRTNAAMNEHAVMRNRISMDDYLAARMIREPLCMLDMDLPVDGGDALVITTAERARDLSKPPVLIHAAAFGQTAHPQEDQTISLREHGQTVASRTLWAKSDLGRDDIDVLFPYDGFTIITLLWLESLGYCGFGEAGPFLEGHWDKDEGRVKIAGRILVNTHGGSLSEGGTQGSGHLREAVVQLRGDAGARQVPGARAALVTPGGLFFNSTAFVLRTDG
jgi:acetyl-CoA acetyltransferase